MDRLHAYYNNVRNEIVCEDGRRVPVERKRGHPWFYMDSAGPGITFLTEPEIPGAFLTERELRRIHRRFGHPSVDKLWKLLQRAGEDADLEAIQMINKVCHFCQKKGKAPQRFKFALKEDIDFNYEVIIDVVYLDGRPVLHAIDASTSYQAARFLTDMSAKETWEALKQCWIDTYLGPPDVLTFDPGPNFRATEFHAEARLLGITCNQVPVEAHWAVGKIERFHAPLRRAYEIIRDECGTECSQGAVLQAAVKAVNDTAGPDGLVPTLLVFGALPRLTMDSPPTPTQAKRAGAVNKAMAELRKLTAKRKVNDALAARNGPDLKDRLPTTLALGSEVLVYREKGNWNGPYKVVCVTENNVTVALPNGNSEFRSTHVKPYYRYQKQPDKPLEDQDDFVYPEEPKPRKRGRPKAIPKEPIEQSQPQATDPPGETQHPPLTGENTKTGPEPVEGEPTAEEEDLTIEVAGDHNEQRRSGRRRKPKAHFDTLMSSKETQSYELALKYRAEGKITTPGAPFEQSDAAEIEALLGAEVLQPVHGENARGRIFGARMVREVKGTADRPYEKSRLVVQGHSDNEKKSLLTQAPTIMRCSQRLILSIAPSLMAQDGYKLMIRDISQAYTQSKSQLVRDVLVRIPKELQHKYPKGTYLKVNKPLYGLAESGLHWFDTYQRHHKERLNCATSEYDACLLITKSGPFGLVGLQTDDTLNLGDPEFIATEETELQRAALLAKPQKIMGEGDTEDFNGCKITLKRGVVHIQQKGQADRLELINPKSPDRSQQYVAQRARGAYIATICQPEAAFDLSVAAQTTDPTDAEIERLNKRIQWQIENNQRGLT
uniref:Integrase catalytic domain-containing protein n=1 Tax=Pyricularia oryzae (strain P131) TaxID=1143193 RepID=L7JQT6_PYRO1